MLPIGQRNGQDPDYHQISCDLLAAAGALLPSLLVTDLHHRLQVSTNTQVPQAEAVMELVTTVLSKMM
jgi:hypothetical protein